MGQGALWQLSISFWLISFFITFSLLTLCTQFVPTAVASEQTTSVSFDQYRMALKKNKNSKTKEKKKTEQT